MVRHTGPEFDRDTGRPPSRTGIAPPTVTPLSVHSIERRGR
ncbi:MULTISPECIES: hypothetical protein [Halomicrobium]|nr:MULTISPECIES: hypothetical protein [Halomicrobium]